MKSDDKYLHGYSDTERNRLSDQADFLETMIYEFLDLSSCRRMLEVGCGTGGQSKILLSKYPLLAIDAVDISETQIAQAKKEFDCLPNIKNRINFIVGDAHSLELKKASYDSIFIVWVLEHLKDPAVFLKSISEYLQPGGKIYITEVYNNSLFVSPESPYQMEYFKRYGDLQTKMGGDPILGIKLGNLLFDAGFTEIKTRNLNRHYDKSNIYAKKRMFDYWKSLLLSAKDKLLAEKMVDEKFIELTLKEIDLVKEDKDSIFYYCPIQAEASKAL